MKKVKKIDDGVSPSKKAKNILASIGLVSLCALIITTTAACNKKDNTLETTENKETTLEIVAPNGYHVEGNLIVKNPDGLVSNPYNPKAGYHTQAYEYDSELAYEVLNGYHIESGRVIPDGYHLEDGNTIVKNLTP